MINATSQTDPPVPSFVTTTPDFTATAPIFAATSLNETIVDCEKLAGPSAIISFIIACYLPVVSGKDQICLGPTSART